MVLNSLNLTVPVPCTLGGFGDKLVTYQTQVKPTEIINLLGHDPRSKYWTRLPDELREMYQTLQRKTNKGRRENTRRYIEERIFSGMYVLGAFPAIAIGTVSPLKFNHYADKYPGTGIPRGVGEIEFDLSTTSKRVLLDGMARVAGALELVDEGKSEAASSFAFPVTIYSPSQRLGKVTVQELGQLFHDFNFLAEPVSRAQAIDLDQSNIYIQLVNALSRSPVIRNNGGIEARAASLGKKSTALVAKQVLLRFVRGAIDGASAQERLRDNVQDSNLTPETLPQHLEKIEFFLTKIADGMGPNFADHDLLHLTAPGWNALGVVCHDIFFVLGTSLRPDQIEGILNRIGTIDWSRWNQDFIRYLGEVAFESDGQEVKRGRGRAAPIDPTEMREIIDTSGRRKLGTLYGGRLGVTRFIQYIREKSGILPLLRDAAPDLVAEAEAVASAEDVRAVA